MVEGHEGEPSKPNTEPYPHERGELVDLQESLGFAETDELAAIHDHIVEAAKADNTEARRRLFDAYQTEALGIIGDNPPLDIRHGYLIAQAVIKLDAGYDFACLDDLEDALYSMRQIPELQEAAARLSQTMRTIEFPTRRRR